MEGTLGEPTPTPPTSGQTETPKIQDLGAEDAVVLLHEEEMTDSPKQMRVQHLRYCSSHQWMLMQYFYPVL